MTISRYCGYAFAAVAFVALAGCNKHEDDTSAVTPPPAATAAPAPALPPPAATTMPPPAATTMPAPATTTH
ncbi:MAG TPA: hypothetical protein VFG49_09075 [Dyella sp.]|uniref:hypothetical protein n=1 Tax=Dyella sp. TaxID=1869338 RepID=UPI002D781ACB|nr:hypothetical protein [Dyella sp.]HET6553675.1 hypothetical protein [Dyella sp.]